MTKPFLHYTLLWSGERFTYPSLLNGETVPAIKPIGGPAAQDYEDLEYFSVPTKGKILHAYSREETTSAAVKRWIDGEDPEGNHFLYVAQKAPYVLHSFQSSSPLYMYGLYSDRYDILAVTDIENLDELIKLSPDPTKPWCLRLRAPRHPSFSINVSRTRKAWKKWKIDLQMHAGQRFSVLETHILSQCVDHVNT